MRKGDYITTISGRKFWPLDPHPEDVDIHDIAWALSRICRFGGHTNSHYSVATHCTAVSLLVPEEDALWGLLHDASEAYVGDMVRPLKDGMDAYKQVENRVELVIANAFGLPLEMPESVHLADKRIVQAEKFLFTNQTVCEDLSTMDEDIAAINKALETENGPVDVYLKYLSRFQELHQYSIATT